MQPLISIIIPTYNRRAFIGDTLDSILAQTYANWECIIVDDGSTDDSKNIVKHYILQDYRFAFRLRPENYPKGANACRNYGMSICKGKYILFLDADDILHQACLEERLKLFAKDEAIDFVIADTGILLNDKLGTKSINFDPKDLTSESYLLLFLSYKIPWAIMSVLWRKEVLKYYSFDESLQRLQDIDFHISILKHPYKIARLHSIDNYYRVDPNKIKNQQHIKSVLENLLPFFNKHLSYILTNVNHQNAFKLFNIYFLYQYILPNHKVFKSLINTLLKHMFISDLFSKKELFIIKIQIFLVCSGLDQIKYLGIYTFNQFLKQKLQSLCSNA